MSPEKFHDALNYLDDDLITQTDELRRGQRVAQRHPTARQIVPWVAAAACLTLVIGIGPRLLPSVETDNAANGTPEMMHDAQEAPMPGLTEDQNYGSAEANIGQSRSEYTTQRIACGNITLEIPDTWEHEIVKEDGGGYFLHIRPPYEEGYIRVGYWQGFAVCGTGLHEEEAVIAGRNVFIGTYDGNPVWNFITLGDDYVVINEGANDWWGAHGDTVMEILETIVIE